MIIRTASAKPWRCARLVRRRRRSKSSAVVPTFGTLAHPLPERTRDGCPTATSTMVEALQMIVPRTRRDGRTARCCVSRRAWTGIHAGRDRKVGDGGEHHVHRNSSEPRGHPAARVRRLEAATETATPGLRDDLIDGIKGYYLDERVTDAAETPDPESSPLSSRWLRITRTGNGFMFTSYNGARNGRHWTRRRASRNLNGQLCPGSRTMNDTGGNAPRANAYAGNGYAGTDLKGTRTTEPPAKGSALERRWRCDVGRFRRSHPDADLHREAQGRTA